MLARQGLASSCRRTASSGERPPSTRRWRALWARLNPISRASRRPGCKPAKLTGREVRPDPHGCRHSADPPRAREADQAPCANPHESIRTAVGIRRPVRGWPGEGCKRRGAGTISRLGGGEHGAASDRAGADVARRWRGPRVGVSGRAQRPGPVEEVWFSRGGGRHAGCGSAWRSSSVSARHKMLIRTRRAAASRLRLITVAVR